MTQIQGPAVEVRCDDCNVSFPPGTKRCIHCGEKIGGLLFVPVENEEGIPVLESADLEDAEVEPRGGRVMRVGFTVFWLLLALISAAARSCQGQ